LPFIIHNSNQKIQNSIYEKSLKNFVLSLSSKRNKEMLCKDGIFKQEYGEAILKRKIALIVKSLEISF